MIQEVHVRAKTLAGTIVAGITLAVLAGAGLAGAGYASAQSLHADGQMRCSVAGGFGYGIFGQRAINCTWRRFDGTVEFYLGSSGKVGVDVGPTNAVSVIYDVRTPDPAPAGLLQGSFAGPGIDLTVISGYGANVLVGDQGVVLTPAANTFATGLNVGIGMSRLRLTYAGREPPRRGRR